MPIAQEIIDEAKRRLSTATDDELLDAVAELAVFKPDELTAQQSTVQAWITDELESRHPAFEEASENWVHDLAGDRSHAEFTLDHFGRAR